MISPAALDTKSPGTGVNGPGHGRHPGGADMSDATQQLEARVAELEALVHRLLLVVGAAGTMLAEVRRDEGDQ
jgi:hypothetical protein